MPGITKRAFVFDEWKTLAEENPEAALHRRVSPGRSLQLPDVEERLIESHITDGGAAQSDDCRGEGLRALHGEFQRPVAHDTEQHHRREGVTGADRVHDRMAR